MAQPSVTNTFATACSTVVSLEAAAAEVVLKTLCSRRTLVSHVVDFLVLRLHVECATMLTEGTKKFPGNHLLYFGYK